MIWFTGDINLTEHSFDVGFGVGTMIKKGGDPFNRIKKDPGDVWVGNFEGVCSDVSELNGYNKNTFRLPTIDLYNISPLIDYYGLANNHVMEHGEQAYRETVIALKNVCKGTFGSVEEKYVTFEHQGKSVSVMGFSLRNDQLGFKPLYWVFPENHEIEKEFEEIKKSDFKVAYLHWGVEFVDHPYHEQKRFAHWLIDIGFDLVVGMHPHVVQGFEIYNGKYIFYSLGNFVFNMAWAPSKFGLIVNVDLHKGEVGYNYIKIDKSFSPEIVSEGTVPEKWRMSALCPQIPNNENVEPYIAKANIGLGEYRKANYKYMINNITKYNYKVTFAMIVDFIRRRF